MAARPLTFPVLVLVVLGLQEGWRARQLSGELVRGGGQQSKGRDNFQYIQTRTSLRSLTSHPQMNT